MEDRPAGESKVDRGLIVGIELEDRAKEEGDSRREDRRGEERLKRAL